MDRIERYDIEDLKNLPSKKVFTNFGQGEIDLCELHVYGGDTLLATEYDVDTFRIDRYIKKGRKRKRPRVELDIHNDIRDLGFTSGLYKVHYNFFRDVLGSYNQNKGLHIAEISDSRTEIRIKTTSSDEEFLQEFEELQEKNIEDFVDDNWQDLLANFGDNNVHLIVNWQSDGDDGILLKLYKPLPNEIQVKQQLWIVKEVVTSHTEMIKLIPAEKPAVGDEIAGPNFTIDITKGVGGETGWETWNSILGTNATTKQKLMNLYTSGSAYEQAHLNIDYYKYENFVHFSSAKERLENFKYKLGLIEYYDNQIATINAMSNTGYHTNKNLGSYKIKKEEVIQGFDGYESYLYFQSSSYEPDQGEGARLERTWPKSNGVEPYTNRTIDDPIAVSWFASQSNVALDYDVHNPHNLENTIPFHVREAGDGNDNANYLLFVNMVAHHFDTVYNYLDYTMQIHKRSNPLYEGLSKDLVYNVLSSFGWESYQGFHFTDLWEYALGQNEDGSFANSSSSFAVHISGSGAHTVRSGSVKFISASAEQSAKLNRREDLSRETWKRMLNNLPYLMKTKGGERGIRALTTTYGLPPTLLRIFEYGGPQKAKKTDSYVKYDRFNYSLEFAEECLVKTKFPRLPGTHPCQSFTNIHDRAPDAIEFRFNTWHPVTMSIFTGRDVINSKTMNSLRIIPHPSALNKKSRYYKYGKLQYVDISNGNQTTGNVTGSTEYLPLYDNDWWSVMLCRRAVTGNQAAGFFQSGQTFELVCAKSPDHSDARITHTGSTSVTVASEVSYNGINELNWGLPHTTHLGGPSQGYSGSLQDIRFWYTPAHQYFFEYWNPNHINHNATSSDPSPFWNHVRAPLSIEGVSATSSFAQLAVRHSLGLDLDRVGANYFTNANWDATLLGSTGVVMSSSAPQANHRYVGNDDYEAINTLHHGGLPSFNINTTVATASGFSGNITNDWPTEEEKHYTPMPDLVRTREISDKVRIESAELKGRLSDKIKVERSQFDKAPLDSNRLGVYFAPHFEIDLDIAHELGGADFHNYVGNPLDYRDDEYKRLRVLRNFYWRKHTNPYNFFEFLRILKFIDHTLFRQIEMLIPARANAQVGLLVKANLLERPKVENLQEYVEENHYGGTLDISKYRVTANTTTLGGPFHQWQNPKNLVWSTGSDQAGTKAIQAHTGYQTLESGSSYGVTVTDQSSGEVEAHINARKHHGHDLDIDGSRYYWDNMVWYVPSSSNGGPLPDNNPNASVVIGGASYENAGDFLSNISDGTLTASVGYGPDTTAQTVPSTYFGFENFQHRHTSQSVLSADTFKNKQFAFDHPAYGHVRRPVKIARWNDRGNIKYYHHQRASRLYWCYEYHYMGLLNNMYNSGSTGGKFSSVSMSGYPGTELSKGYFRSGIRPVSKSLKRAEHQDYISISKNNLLYGGCKLVGSDFNMPVTDTIDGGPVVEITDTNPNQLVISTPAAGQSEIQAVNVSNAIR